MKDTINEQKFIDRLLQDENAGWSRKGAEALFEYLTQYEEETGEEIEVDPVALRCDFDEWKDINEFLDSYPEIKEEIDEDETEEVYQDRRKEEVKKAIEEKTTLIPFDNDDLDAGFITQAF
jgi:hypothetical protein